MEGWYDRNFGNHHKQHSSLFFHPLGDSPQITSHCRAHQLSFQENPLSLSPSISSLLSPFTVTRTTARLVSRSYSTLSKTKPLKSGTLEKSNNINYPNLPNAKDPKSIAQSMMQKGWHENYHRSITDHILPQIYDLTRSTPPKDLIHTTYYTPETQDVGHNRDNYTLADVPNAQSAVRDLNLLRFLFTSFSGGGYEITPEQFAHIERLTKDKGGIASTAGLLTLYYKDILNRTRSNHDGKVAVDGKVVLGARCVVHVSGHAIYEDARYITQAALATTTNIHNFDGRVLWSLTSDKQNPNFLLFRFSQAGEHPLNVFNAADRLNNVVGSALSGLVFRMGIENYQNIGSLPEVLRERAGRLTLDPDIARALDALAAQNGSWLDRIFRSLIMHADMFPFFQEYRFNRPEATIYLEESALDRILENPKPEVWRKELKDGAQRFQKHSRDEPLIPVDYIFDLPRNQEPPIWIPEEPLLDVDRSLNAERGRIISDRSELERKYRDANEKHQDQLREHIARQINELEHKAQENEHRRSEMKQHIDRSRDNPNRPRDIAKRPGKPGRKL
ncbi:MAG TPA: hypothetical protein VHT24_09895 [Pseudacidobacterium sp.]|nr:hypothetical protein [Pseudacidobacterium sp.]